MGRRKKLKNDPQFCDACSRVWDASDCARAYADDHRTQAAKLRVTYSRGI